MDRRQFHIASAAVAGAASMAVGSRAAPAVEPVAPRPEIAKVIFEGFGDGENPVGDGYRAEIVGMTFIAPALFGLGEPTRWPNMIRITDTDDRKIGTTQIARQIRRQMSGWVGNDFRYQFGITISFPNGNSFVMPDTFLNNVSYDNDGCAVLGFSTRGTYIPSPEA